MKAAAVHALAVLALFGLGAGVPSGGRQAFRLAPSTVRSGHADDAVANRARALHASALVMDAHIDTTLRLTRADWDFTREHQPFPAGTSSHRN